MKELRLRGIGTIDAANAVLPGFVADHNARFAEAPRSPKDLHCPLPARDDADGVAQPDAAIRQGERGGPGARVVFGHAVLFHRRNRPERRRVTPTRRLRRPLRSYRRAERLALP